MTATMTATMTMLVTTFDTLPLPGPCTVIAPDGSEAERELGVPERAPQNGPSKAQSTAVARATARICNAAGGVLGWPGGHDRFPLSLSAVRVLLRLPGGQMAHFQLAPGQVSRAVAHRTVEEVWYVLSGEGEMWRRQGAREVVTALHAGLCLTIPLGTAFQFRATGAQPLAAVAVTMPPWPGDDEAYAVAGKWA